MAAYRKISVTFWADSFIQSLTPESKYFYLYLMTNTRTTQCGIYEITLSQMCFETGYNAETINKLIEQFEKTGRIKYSKKTNEIALKNWPKYNESGSPKVAACVENELKSVKNRVLIQYLYSMDTQPQETKAKEEAKEEQETEAVGDGAFSVIVKSKYLNEKTKRVFSLEKFFEETKQWEQIQMAHWAERAEDFMKANPGRVFNSQDHLYNTFKKFCLEPPKQEKKVLPDLFKR
jgi:hypothetical protein